MMKILLRCLILFLSLVLVPVGAKAAEKGNPSKGDQDWLPALISSTGFTGGLCVHLGCGKRLCGNPRVRTLRDGSSRL